jgi:hypothetical protein
MNGLARQIPKHQRQQAIVKILTAKLRKYLTAELPTEWTFEIGILNHDYGGPRVAKCGSVVETNWASGY